MATSSIHITTAGRVSIPHIVRAYDQAHMPHSIKFDSGKNEYLYFNEKYPELTRLEAMGKKNNFTEVKNFQDAIFKEKHKDYLEEQKNTRGVKAVTVFKEAVVNLEAHHTKYDLMQVCKALENRFELKPYIGAIHRDEGHINLQGKEDINHHGHILFHAQKNNGKAVWFSKKDLKEMQSIVAETLGMKRGVENSKAVRLEHKEYRRLAEGREKIQELEKTLTIEKGAVRDIENNLYENTEYLTNKAKELSEELEQVESQYNKARANQEDLKQQVSKLWHENYKHQETQKEQARQLKERENYPELKKENISLKVQLDIEKGKNNLLEIRSMEASKLEKENSELKKEKQEHIKESAKAQSKYMEKENECRELSGANELLTIRVTDALTYNIQLKTETNTLKDKISIQQNELNDSRYQAQRMIEKSRGIFKVFQNRSESTEVKHLKDQVETLTRSNAKIQNQKETNEYEASKQIGNLQKKNDNAQEKIQQLKKDAVTLEKEILAIKPQYQSPRMIREQEQAREMAERQERFYELLGKSYERER